VARWGTLQGGLGVCIIVSSAAVGTIATMVVRSMPGLLLGIFVIAGTVVAALAVRPSAGRTIVPVPALAYLMAALVSGVVYDHSAASSKAALAIGAAQWIADGFLAMVLATALAVTITVARWFLWRRSRPVARDRTWNGADPRGDNPAGLSGPRSRPRSGLRPLQLLERGVAEHQVLDAVVGTEVDLRLGLVPEAVGGHHGAQAELVVGHHVPGRQRGHHAVSR
jgi:hypothetical protein